MESGDKAGKRKNPALEMQKGNSVRDILLDAPDGVFYPIIYRITRCAEKFDKMVDKEREG